VRSRSFVKTQPKEVIAHLKQAINDQLTILSLHVQQPGGLDPMFIREHAMIIVQMAEVLVEPDQRLYTVVAGQGALVPKGEG
jgi:hypothetical protein